MGQIFQQGGMTNPGTALQGADGSTTVGRPDKILSMADKSLQARVQPGDIGQQDMSGLPRIGQPSLQQAAAAGATPGGANALSPGLNKAGKLVTLLTSGLQGALAGRRASEEAVIASGGRRSGGAGMGFEAGYTLPWQRQAQKQSVERGGLENQILGNQVQYAPALNFLKMLQGQAEVGKTQAETGKANAEVAGMPIKQALEAAQTEAANYKDDPNLGLIDLRTKQPVNPAGFAPLTAGEAQVLGRQQGERVPLKLKNIASEIAVRGLSNVTTEEGVFERNRNTGDMTRLGSNPRMMFSPEQRIVPGAADPNDPGNLTYMRAGDAMRTGAQAPGSAGVLAAKTAAKSEVPTNIGNQKVAFSTAIQHADLLKSAIAALGNGDQQTLSSLKNKFKTEFGIAGPITAQAIADAYTREITSVLSKGHITDSEIGSVGKTLNVNAQSPSQSLGVIEAYRALAQSKMNMLQKQVDAAKGGKSSGMPKGASHIVPGPDGKNHYTNAKGTVDLGVAP